MPVRSLFLPLLAASLACASSAEARVVPNKQAEGEVILLSPLSLVKVDDLDFGWLTVTAAGTAVINPVTGVVTTTGGVLPVGGAPQAARFAGAASRNSPIKIRIPNKPTILTRQGGTETMSLSTWTLDGPADRKVGPSRAFDFYVGGTLTVAANQADGLYVGTFDVEVQYP